MRQQVTVFSVHGGRATVRFSRPTACHGDCGHCAGGCGSLAAKEIISVDAENPIGAVPGDQVLIEGDARKVAWAVALVYVLPLVLFFAGYFLGQNWGNENLFGVLGFLLGLALAAAESWRQRKFGGEIQYRIVAFAPEADRK